MKFKQRIILLKNDRLLLMIFYLHLILVACHLLHSVLGDVQYHYYLRAIGCSIIATLILLFGRKGLSYGFLIHACLLIYINQFYNYASIFLILVAIGANPKNQRMITIIYLINMVISFSIQKVMVYSAAVHIVYMIVFFICIRYVFKINTPENLNLSEDEKKILKEMLNGKKQKEIDLFSQQTISQKLKNARERNFVETTSELLSRFSNELKATNEKETNKLEFK